MIGIGVRVILIIYAAAFFVFIGSAIAMARYVPGECVVVVAVSIAGLWAVAQIWKRL